MENIPLSVLKTVAPKIAKIVTDFNLACHKDDKPYFDLERPDTICFDVGPFYIDFILYSTADHLYGDIMRIATKSPHLLYVGITSYHKFYFKFRIENKE